MLVTIWVYKRNNDVLFGARKICSYLHSSELQNGSQEWETVWLLPDFVRRRVECLYSVPSHGKCIDSRWNSPRPSATMCAFPFAFPYWGYATVILGATAIEQKDIIKATCRVEDPEREESQRSPLQWLFPLWRPAFNSIHLSHSLSLQSRCLEPLIIRNTDPFCLMLLFSMLPFRSEVIFWESRASVSLSHNSGYCKSTNQVDLSMRLQLVSSTSTDKMRVGWLS